MEISKDFKQNIDRILYEKANLHPVTTNKVVYTNGTGILPYKGKQWYADIYCFCSKMAHEKPDDNTLRVIFYVKGKNIMIGSYVHVKDLTNALSLLRNRFLDEPYTSRTVKNNLHQIETFYVDFRFKEGKGIKVKFGYIKNKIFYFYREIKN